MLVPPDARRNAFVMQPGDGRPIHVLGNEVRIQISSADTGGAFTVFEGQTQPLAGPPLHRHRDQDEWWYILGGEFRFEVDGREIYARAGETVFAPRGSRHTFQNIGSVPGRTLTTVVPGGVDLFFEELESAAPRGTVADAAKILPIFKKHGQELLGPPLRREIYPDHIARD
jgi:mannose-6-phosphate isomerase-like protein (cupin superfamily)